MRLLKPGRLDQHYDRDKKSSIMPTFVAVDVGVLDNHGPAVDCRVLLGLSLGLSYVPTIFRSDSRS